MDVLIKKDSGSFRFSSKGVHPLSFDVSSIEQMVTYSNQEGRNGRIDNGATDISRIIRVPCYFYHPENWGYTLLVDEIFGMFDSKQPFFISEMADDGSLVSGKQYQVRLSQVISPDRDQTFGQTILEFETSSSPYGQSIYTTQEIQVNGIKTDNNWAFGMGLETKDDSELRYTHQAVAAKTFTIFNAGNVDVHPFEDYLKLEISNVVGALSQFQITNLTNSTRIRISAPVLPTDKWIYDGPTITRNGLAATKFTRKDFIYLSPGVNKFQIYYCESADLSFDFKFLYR